MQQLVSWQAVLGHPRQSRFQECTLERLHVLCSVPLSGYVIWLLGGGGSTGQQVPSLLWAQLTPVLRVRARQQHGSTSPSEPQLALGVGWARAAHLSAGEFYRGYQCRSE